MRFFAKTVVLAAGTIISGAAHAAVLEFDVDGVLSIHGALDGTFLFDTATQSVTEIDVTGMGGLGSLSYNSSSTASATLVRDGTDPAPFDFTTIELYFDATMSSLLQFNIDGFQTVMPGLAVGEELFLGTTGLEIASGVGSGAFIDSTIVVTRLLDPDPAPSQVPLPAGLPLMLASIGAFGFLRLRTV